MISASVVSCNTRSNPVVSLLVPKRVIYRVAKLVEMRSQLGIVAFIYLIHTFGYTIKCTKIYKHYSKHEAIYDYEV